MEIRDQLTSGLKQVLVVLVIGAIYWSIHRLIYRRSFDHGSLLTYLGLKSGRRQLDSRFWWILVGALIFGIACTLLQWFVLPGFREILTSDNSPYGNILKARFTTDSVIRGLIYCTITSAGAEEIIFRGLFARRLFVSMGFKKGNVLQAAIFWLMHLIIFRLVTGDWFSLIQLLALIVSFSLGLLNGFLNYRKGNESILPGWIIHASVNFITFLTLAYLV